MHHPSWPHIDALPGSSKYRRTTLTVFPNYVVGGGGSGHTVSNKLSLREPVVDGLVQYSRQRYIHSYPLCLSVHSY